MSFPDPTSQDMNGLEGSAFSDMMMSNSNFFGLNPLDNSGGSSLMDGSQSATFSSLHPFEPSSFSPGVQQGPGVFASSSSASSSPSLAPHHHGQAGGGSHPPSSSHSSPAFTGGFSNLNLNFGVPTTSAISPRSAPVVFPLSDQGNINPSSGSLSAAPVGIGVVKMEGQSSSPFSGAIGGGINPSSISPSAPVICNPGGSAGVGRRGPTITSPTSSGMNSMPLFGSPAASSNSTSASTGTPSASSSIPSSSSSSSSSASSTSFIPSDAANQNILTLLHHVESSHWTFNTELERLRSMHRMVGSDVREDVVTALLQSDEHLLTLLQQQIHAIADAIRSSVILFPSLYRLWRSLDALLLQQAELGVYYKELTEMSGRAAVTNQGVYAALHISQQPFPLVLVKGHVCDEAEYVEVRFFVGPRTTFQSLGPVRCIPSVASIGDSNSSQPQGMDASVVEPNSAQLDSSSQAVVFKLRFAQGTRKLPIRFSFSVLARLQNGGDVELRSPLSRPCIVMTNESQFEELSRNVMHSIAFEDSESCPWPLYANHLQHAFVIGMRQDLSNPARPLSIREIDFIHYKWFGGAADVTLHQSTVFWEWFGKVLRKMRYERHLSTLWDIGAIFGFIGREDVEQILSTQSTGSCIIRFSDHHPRCFAVGYKTESETNDTSSVHHYLVTEEDTSMKKTLPDFICEFAPFVYICQLVGDEKIQFVHKDSILGPLYTVRPNVSIQGYETASDRSVPRQQQLQLAKRTKRAHED